MKPLHPLRRLGLVASFLVAASSAAACNEEAAGEAGPPEPRNRQSRALVAAPPVEPVTVAATRDTTIRLIAPNRNFGGEATIGVHRGLVGFDRAALQAAVAAQDYVVSARLELTVAVNRLPSLAPTRALSLHRLLRPWTETGATWNCAVDARPNNNAADCTGAARWSMAAPPLPFVATPTATATLSPRQTGVLAFDITTDVRALLAAGADATADWVLKGDWLADLLEMVAFHARESASGPRLVLTVQRCSPLICDDGDACTVDSCGAIGQCLHTPAEDGTACTDGDDCTQPDRCQAGVCRAGVENVCVPPPIVINEVESSGGVPGDFVELVNTGTRDADLGGWVFKDNDDTHVYVLPAGTTVPAGGHLTLDEATLGFGLGSADSARIFDGRGTLVDSYTWTTHAATTYGRCPNGSGPFSLTASPTKNAANDCTRPGADAGADVGPPDAEVDAGAGGPVTINEIESNQGVPGDWVELFNGSSSAIDVGGWVIKDNDDTHVAVLPAGSNIPASGFLIVEEASLGYGLGAADAVRLYRADGSLADSHAWTVHAATTYARCPDGTGAFALSSAATKGTGNSCGGSVDAGAPDAGADAGAPGEPWPGSATVTTADRAGAFGSNLSGLSYQPAGASEPAILWAAQNSPSKIHRLAFDGTTWVNSSETGWATGKLLTYPNGAGAPDTEGLTKAEFSAPFVYVASERDNTNNTVSRQSVLRYDTSAAATTLVATHEWNLTGDLPVVGPNLGIEAVTWVANEALVAGGFFDEGRNAAYDPAAYPNHGDGIFFVGVESTGMIYGYALDHGSGGFTRVATFASGQAGVMGLEYDRDNGVLWSHCDNTCGNRATLFTLAPDAPNQGRFVLRTTLERPAGMPATLNHEGVALAPMSECAGGLRRIFWSDDGATDGHSLRAGALSCVRLQP